MAETKPNRNKFVGRISALLKIRLIPEPDVNVVGLKAINWMFHAEAKSGPNGLKYLNGMKSCQVYDPAWR